MASEVGAHESSSDGVGSGRVGRKSPLASEISGQTAETTIAGSNGAQKESNGSHSFAPQTPAMSDETNEVDGEHVDDSFDLDDDEELDLTAEMERLGLDEENSDGDDGEGGAHDENGESFDLDDSHDSRDASAMMEEEEAEVRRRVDAEFEMNLRRAELKHVELELKLVASEETVRAAREALAAAEHERENIQANAHAAWEEVGEVEQLIAEEKARREEEDAVKQKVARQARAVVDADELRKNGNEAYRNGECADAELRYKSAIDALEGCDIALVEPSHLTLRTNRAAALMALGRMREALTECEQVLEINPGNIRALSRAGNCCVKLGNLVAAKAHVDTILNAPHASPEDVKSANDQHQKILVASVERDRLVGNDAYRRGDYRGALTWYDAALDAAKDVAETQKDNNDDEHADGLLNVKVGLHTNRAAAHLMRGAPLAAAEDCCAALRLDSSHTKAQVRLARCLLQLGDFSEARQEATDVAERAGGELQSKSEARGVLEDIAAVESASRDAGDSLKLAEIKKQQAEDQPERTSGWVDDFDIAGTAAEAMRSVDAAVALAPAVPDLITLKAEALRFLDKRDEALALLKGKKSVNARRACVEIRLHFDAGNLSACLESAAEIKDVLDAIPEYAARRLRGKENGGDETAKSATDPETEEFDNDITEELRSVPDPEGLLLLLEKATKIGDCKDAGREAFKSGEHREALSTYAEALRMSSGTPSLEGLFLSNMCACEQALGQYADALSSAGTAVGVAPKFLKAHSRLATIYVELGMFDDAQAAYQNMLGLPLEQNESAQTRASLASVTTKSKQAHPIDWIKLLGVTQNASPGEMKKAYRQLALAHHPDKAKKLGASAGVAKARAAISSKLFKHIGEANRVLTDATEKMRWENAKSKAERAARTASYATQSRAAGFGHFDPYDRKHSGGYYQDFEEEAFSYDEYAYSEFYDDYGYQ